jgi:hypothetical protein
VRLSHGGELTAEPRRGAHDREGRVEGVTKEDSPWDDDWVRVRVRDRVRAKVAWV